MHQPHAQALLNAIATAARTQPELFPNRREFNTRAHREPIYGWSITDDTRTPGDLALLPDKLHDLASHAGITNVRATLQQLAAQGILLRSSERDSRLARQIRVGTQIARVYLLHNPERTELPPAALASVDLHEALTAASVDLNMPVVLIVHDALQEWLKARNYLPTASTQSQ